MLIQSTITGTPLRSQVSMVLKRAPSMIAPAKPRERAPLSMFAPVVPLTGLDRHALASFSSDASRPKYAATILRHAGPQSACPCSTLVVLRRTPGTLLGGRLSRAPFIAAD